MKFPISSGSQNQGPPKWSGLASKSLKQCPKPVMISLAEVSGSPVIRTTMTGGSGSDYDEEDCERIPDAMGRITTIDLCF